MLVNRVRSLCLSALLAGLLSSTALAESRYSSIWNLGDSLSDTGRTYRATDTWLLRAIKKTRLMGPSMSKVGSRTELSGLSI
ncbi:hypothetical protein MET9862_00435 [Methylobacterium symbioticum]|uniref:Uncharacterized protein n=1 Tax=Methylobacterium symbioticum TaxID=2584084 RepID=A0A509E8E3_9HYPH|nr:hypothetical protein MET9862_00435 [Methylobacterium symbioticum]